MGRQQLYIPGRFGKADKSRTAELEICSQQAYTLKPRGLEENKTLDLSFGSQKTETLLSR
jgi:hypothetical protein